MKFEIKNNKIYRKGEEIRPNTNGTGGKVVQGTSAKGLWFDAETESESFRVYKKDLLNLSKNAHEIFFNYCNNGI